MQKRIMLIMPEIPLRETFKSFLKEMGYKVFVQDNPRLVNQTYQQFRPNLVMCYEKIQGVQGEQIASMFKGQTETANTPFLMVSSKVLTDELCRTIDLKKMNVDDLIHMPVEQGDLYGYVTNWLESDNPNPLTMAYTPDIPKRPAKATPEVDTAWQKGTVSPFSIGRLFSRLNLNGATGTLMIKGERKKMKLWIKQGQIVDVQSNYVREDTLGLYLISIGKLTKEQNKMSLAFAKEYDIQQGKALVRLGFMDKESISHHLTEHKLVKILNIFQRRWYKAQFNFTECDVDRKANFFQPTPVSKIVGMGIMSIARKKDLYDAFYQKNRENTKLKVCDDFDTIASRFDFGPAMIKQAYQMSGNSLEEIKHTRRDQFDGNLRLAFLMVVTRGMCFNC